MLSDTDKSLISALKENARLSVSDLARKLSLSRSTIQNRLARLESTGVITGYSVKLSETYLQNRVSAHVSIKVKQKLTTQTNVELKRFTAITQLYAISGEYDLIAIVEESSLEQLSHTLDLIGNLDGVERTTSSVILETKFKR
ncbi:Lrp/AsnC family transcriptional regulator [Pseudoalteromonas sp. G4]|uniref:Lrp/AsnC family transcriptional regulator n=1 Tax=Pseudoalteromonas sp. G4 TaxID=2992761 RepID=UPI00237DDB0C|nr:Lrp/AsnC family transcriptional regulator [Pseudoalteromonas sp. G4]MDE3271060.1 Lrp/AsnC family transcriptional regulator [Pseudoalteromonas sp. G4]